MASATKESVTTATLSKELVARYAEEVGRLFRSHRITNLKSLSNTGITNMGMAYFLSLPPEEKDKAFAAVILTETSQPQVDQENA